MANIAIEVKVGSHPGEWKKGSKWHFSDGNNNSKIHPDTILEIVTAGIEKEFANRGMKEFVDLKEDRNGKSS